MSSESPVLPGLTLLVFFVFIPHEKSSLRLLSVCGNLDNYLLI